MRTIGWVVFIGEPRLVERPPHYLPLDLLPPRVLLVVDAHAPALEEPVADRVRFTELAPALVERALRDELLDPLGDELEAADLRGGNRGKGLRCHYRPGLASIMRASASELR